MSRSLLGMVNMISMESFGFQIIKLQLVVVSLFSIPKAFFFFSFFFFFFFLVHVCSRELYVEHGNFWKVIIIFTMSLQIEKI